MVSTIHFGNFPCCDGHNYVHGPEIESSCDFTTGWHTWTLDWTPNELLYKFDGETMFRHNLNREIKSDYYGSKWTTPFDQYFYVILNVAIGGDFIDGPDPEDTWSYPEAEMWIDSIKITPLEEIVDQSATSCESDPRCENCQDDTEECSGENSYLQYHLLDESYEDLACEPNESMSNGALCGTLKWLCHDPNAQNELNLGEQSVCKDDWGTIGCCYGDDGGESCNRDNLLEDATDIFTYRYSVIDRCGNWKWDAASNDMQLTGDTHVECKAEPTTQPPPTTTTPS